MKPKENYPQAVTKPTETPQVDLPKKPSHKFLVWILVSMSVVLLSFSGYKIFGAAGLFNSRSKSSAECTKLAEIVIAHNWPVKYITCQDQGLAKITNSNLSGHYINFTAGNKTNSCAQFLNSIDPGISPLPVTPDLDPDHCSQWSGAVLSNGQYFYAVGRPTSATDDANINFANVNDTCISLQYSGSIGGGSAKHVLYMYQGKLYDRYDYSNYVRKIALGNCTFNGSVLVGGEPKATLLGSAVLSTITNITISYNTPRDCFAAYTGMIYDKNVQLSDCLAMAASAYQDSSICHVTERLGVKPYAGSGPIVVYPLTGTGGNWDFPYTDTECLDLFANHMAWFDKCSAIGDPATRTKCDTSYNQTHRYLKLVTGNI